MAITNLFRQESDRDNPTLADPYGIQATRGLPVVSKTEGGQTAFISFLGNGECNRALRVYYGAFLLTEYHPTTGLRQWRFHNGTSSNGFDDPIQGRPEFFPELDDCFTEICYIEVRPPADFGEIDPRKLFVIFEGRVVDYYQIGGDGGLEVAGRRYSANPMLVGLDVLRRGQRMPLSRFHAPSWLDFEAHCDEEIEWIGGEGDGLLGTYFNDPELSTPAVIAQVAPFIDFDFTGAARPVGVNVHNWSVRFTGQFKSPTTETITFITRADDSVRLWVNGVQLIDDWTGGAVAENSGSIALNAGQRYDITIEYQQFTGPGVLKLEYESPTIERQLVPIDRLFSSNAASRFVPRWTAHVAFPAATEPALAFESVMQRAPDCHWQDVGINGKLKIKMLIGTNRPVLHSFYFNPNQTIQRSNIVYNSFQTYPRPAEETPNFFHVSYRDVDRIDEILPEKFIPIDRPELRQNLDGFMMDLGVIPLGVMHQSQADRTGETMMRLGADLNRFVILRGMKGSHAIAKGDFVEVTHSIPNWTLPRLFMVIEESFTRGAAGERDFLLQSISVQFYEDGAHGRIQWNARADNLPAFVPPPPASFVTIGEGLRTLPDGTSLTTIEGTVAAAEHPHPQRLRVWLKLETDIAWRLTDRLLVPDPTTREASFMLEGIPKTTGTGHQVKVVSESSAGGLKLPFDQHPIAFVGITTNMVPTPGQPTGFGGAILGQTIRWDWNAPTAADLPLHSHYEMFADAALTVPASGGRRIDTTFLNENVGATGDVNRWLVAVNKSGKRSAPAAATATVSNVPNVTNFAISYDGTNLVATWDEVADPQQRIIGYRLFDVNNAAIGFQEKPPFIIRPSQPVTTLRVKAIDRGGNISAAFASDTETIAPPSAPASGTLTFDGLNVITRWVPSASAGVAAYDVRDNANALLRADYPSTEYREAAVSGQASYTRRVYAIDRFGQRSTSYLEVAQAFAPPAAPASGTVTFDGANIVTRWVPSATAGVIAYDIRDGANALLRADVPATEYREPPVQGQASYTRRVYAVDRFGQRSTAPLEVIQPFTAPNAPADAAGSWNGDEIVWGITPPAVAAQGVAYYQARNTAGALLASRLEDAEFRQPQVFGQQDYTVRFYAVDRLGLTSALLEKTFSIPRPAAPASLAAVFLADEINWSWPIPADPFILYFEIRNAAGVAIKQEARNRWSEPPTYGVTAYTRSVYTVNRAGLYSLAAASHTFNLPAPSAPSGYSVDFNGRQLEHRWNAGVGWTALVNATVNADNSVQKTGGAGGAWDAQAVTVEGIRDSGFVEFQPASDATDMMVGLLDVNSSFSYVDIDFAIYLAGAGGGTVYVFESNVSRGTFGTFDANDVFRVALEGGQVRYYRNGVLFYTSTVAPTAGQAYYAKFSGNVMNARAFGVRLIGNVNLEYEIATDALFANVVARARGNFYSENPANNLARGNVNRYVRAISFWGATSASANAVYANAVPAAPTLAKDTSRDIPNAVTVHVTTAAQRRRFLRTVVQVRQLPSGAFPASTAEGTDRVWRFAADQVEVPLEWSAGGQVEFRFAFEDLFSAALGDYQWTLITHAFRLFGSAELGRIGDVNFDVTSALARLIASRQQVPIHGGGDVRWSAGQAKGEVPSWAVASSFTTANQLYAKTSGADRHSDGIASAEIYSGELVLAFTFDDPVNVNCSLYVGFSANQTVDGFTYYRYAFAVNLIYASDATPPNTNVLRAVHSGTGAAATFTAQFGTYRRGDVIKITRDAANVFRVYQNETLIYTHGAAIAGAFYVKAHSYFVASGDFKNLTVVGTVGTANLLAWSQRFIALPAPPQIAQEGYVAFPAGSATLGAWQGLIGRIQMPASAVVTWQNLTNAEALPDGGLRKLLTAAAGAYNAGASSVQTFTNAGFAEFVVGRSPVVNLMQGGFFGLSATDPDTNYTSVQFGINCDWNGAVQVFESGVSRGTFGTYVAGDVFRVEKYYDAAAAAYKVRYLKNGVAFYTSTVAPAATLRADVAMYAQGEEVLSVRLVQTFQLNAAAANATMVVVDYQNYTPPEPQSNFYDFTLAVHNGDNAKLYLFDGRVLEAGQVIRAGAFLPQASIGQAFIQQAAIVSAMIGALEVKDQHVDFLRANKITAQLLDAFIVFADRIGSRNFVAAGSTTPQAEQIIWINRVGVSVDEITGQIRKNVAGSAWNTAGATSSRAIHSGDGYVEAAVTGVGEIAMVGLSYGNTNADYVDIDFAAYNGAGAFQVYESGTQRFNAGAGSLALGDKLRVAVEGGVVKYYRIPVGTTTPVLMYTSSVAPRYPLLADVAFHQFNDGFANPVIYGILEPVATKKVRWQNVVGAAFDGNDNLYRTAAGSTWGASGASSIDAITGEGFAEAIAPSATTAQHWQLGLNNVDANQDYTDADFAFHPTSGFYTGGASVITIYENGVSRGSFGAYVQGDVLRVAVEGGVVKYRRNGVLIYTSTVAPTLPLYVDVAIYNVGGTIESVRWERAGAIAQGWQADPTGLIQLGRGARIGDSDFFEVQARAIGAIGSDLRYEGNDVSPFLVHKLASVTLENAGIPADGFNLAEFQLAVTWQGFQSDDYANGDSIRQCLCTVKNKFGETVKEFKPFTFVGDGICAFGRHPLMYAEPRNEAIYELRFRNKFGWSLPVWYQNGMLYLSQPPTLRRTDCPQNLNGNVVGYGQGTTPTTQQLLRVAWMYPTTNVGTIGIYVRRPHETAFALLATVTNGAAYYEIDNYIEALGGSESYVDFKVLNNNVANAYSNTIRVWLLSTYVLPSHPAPSGLVAAINSPTSATLRWSAPASGAWSTFNIRKTNLDSGVTNILAPGSTTNITDATLIAGVRYMFVAFANFADGRQGAPSAPLFLQMPPSANAADPTNLSGRQLNNARVDYTWNLNAAAGAVYFDYEYATNPNAFTGVYTTVNLAAGTASYSLQNIPSTANVIRARVRVADAGTSPTNLFDIYVMRVV